MSQLALDLTRALVAPDRWNSRYVAYARAQGRGPHEQVERDRASVSCMTEYIIWNNRQWRTWATEVGRKSLDFLSEAEHAAFDVWLVSRFP